MGIKDLINAGRRLVIVGCRPTDKTIRKNKKHLIFWVNLTMLVCFQKSVLIGFYPCPTALQDYLC